MLVALSSNTTGRSPSYYINPVNNVNYTVAVKIPYEQLNSVKSLLNTPVTNGNTPVAQTVSTGPTDLPMAQTQTLRNLASVSLENQYNLISHYTVQRVMDLTANVDGTGSWATFRTISIKKIAGTWERCRRACTSTCAASPK